MMNCLYVYGLTILSENCKWPLSSNFPRLKLYVV
jgi:hypothetical protein